VQSGRSLVTECRSGYTRLGTFSIIFLVYGLLTSNRTLVRTQCRETRQSTKDTKQLARSVAKDTLHRGLRTGGAVGIGDLSRPLRIRGTGKESDMLNFLHQKSKPSAAVRASQRTASAPLLSLQADCAHEGAARQVRVCRDAKLPGPSDLSTWTTASTT
jgi:hypothetical protein